MSILLIVASGLVGTTAMTITMSMLHRYQWANADMVRAIGSLYTRSYQLAWWPGILVHYSFGLFFSFIYAMLISFAPVTTPGAAMIVVSFVGLAHGLLVGLLLEIVVAEHHPLKQFQEVGFPVVAAHVIGHIVYGVFVGAFFALTWNQIQDGVEHLSQGRAIADLIGFSAIWWPLFGPPFFAIGYFAYWALTVEVQAEAHRLELKQRHSGKALSIKRASLQKRAGSKKSRSHSSRNGRSNKAAA